MENSIKGITLNQQLADLLSIIDDIESKEEQDTLIKDYISKLKDRSEGYSKGGEGFALGYVIDSVCPMPDISRKVMQVYSEKNNGNREVCDSKAVIAALQAKLGMSEVDCKRLHTSILKGLRETDFSAKPGILEMTPDDVRNLYDHIMQEGYNRITMDTCGRYSDFVSIDGETFCPGNIDRMMKFATKHQISTKINTFMMYSDFPNLLDEYLVGQKMDESERAKILKNSLMRYVIEIGARYGDKITAVDMFNELIYNPGTSEKKAIFTEYELDENGHKIQERTDDGELKYDSNGKPVYKEAGFVERSQTGWQKYLTLQDLCEIAVVARAVLPNATFTYNDWNWVIPEKRDAMIAIVNRIQGIQKDIQKQGGITVNEEIATILKELQDKKIGRINLGKDGKLEFGADQTIVDSVGLESHLSTVNEPEELVETVSIIKKETGLPAEVTEEDVAYHKDVEGNEELSKEMQQRQNKLFTTIDKLVKKGILIGSTIWSLGKKSFTDIMYGYCTHASKLDEKFRPKIRERDSIEFSTDVLETTGQRATTYGINQETQHIKFREIDRSESEIGIARNEE